MIKLKQMFCCHWFDETGPYTVSYWDGPIICTEQRTYNVDVKERICFKCGKVESRRVGEPIYIGWS